MKLPNKLGTNSLILVLFHFRPSAIALARESRRDQIMTRRPVLVKLPNNSLVLAIEHIHLTVQSIKDHINSNFNETGQASTIFVAIRT